jgi:hypothetical protein
VLILALLLFRDRGGIDFEPIPILISTNLRSRLSGDFIAVTLLIGFGVTSFSPIKVAEAVCKEAFFLAGILMLSWDFYSGGILFSL